MKVFAEQSINHRKQTDDYSKNIVRDCSVAEYSKKKTLGFGKFRRWTGIGETSSGTTVLSDTSYYQKNRRFTVICKTG